jgi:hypothetical protein
MRYSLPRVSGERPRPIRPRCLDWTATRAPSRPSSSRAPIRSGSLSRSEASDLRRSGSMRRPGLRRSSGRDRARQTPLKLSRRTRPARFLPGPLPSPVVGPAYLVDHRHRPLTDFRPAGGASRHRHRLAPGWAACPKQRHWSRLALFPMLAPVMPRLHPIATPHSKDFHRLRNREVTHRAHTRSTRTRLAPGLLGPRVPARSSRRSNRLTSATPTRLAPAPRPTRSQTDHDPVFRRLP